MRNRYFLVLAVALLAHTPAQSAVPSETTIQGLLVDSTGTAITPGGKGFTFRLFDSETGGNLLWEENQFLSTDDNGLWTAQLGSSVPLFDSDFDDLPRWLEVEVDDGFNPVETFSRVKMSSTPFAYRVSTIDGSSGGIISGDVSIQSNLSVAGNVDVQDTLLVGGHSSTTGNATVTGTLTADSVDVSGGLTVGSDALMSGDADVTGSLTVGVDADVDGNVTVLGDVTASGSISSSTGIGFPDASTQITAAFNVPIGAIIMWHEDFANTPALPDNFVLCEGGLISDPESPYDGQNAPNFFAGNIPRVPISINSVSGVTTGIIGGSSSHNHSHNTTFDGLSAGSGIRHVTTSSTNSSPNYPPYFYVVYIMRIK